MRQKLPEAFCSKSFAPFFFQSSHQNVDGILFCVHFSTTPRAFLIKFQHNNKMMCNDEYSSG